MHRHTHYQICEQGDLGHEPTLARVYTLRGDNEPKHNVWLKLLVSEVESLQYIYIYTHTYIHIRMYMYMCT